MPQSHNQKEFYIGKKKKYTMKNLAITDHQGYSESYMGSVHDKTIWDQIQFELSYLTLLADLGFQGIEHAHPNVILPYKKAKGKELINATEKTNQSSHWVGKSKDGTCFSGVKRLKIIQKKRLKTYLVRDQVFKIAAALHNLRVSFKAIQNHS